MSEVRGDRAGAAASVADAKNEVEPRQRYEPPRVRVIGTLGELTAGTNPTSSDGVGPGSAL